MIRYVSQKHKKRKKLLTSIEARSPAPITREAGRNSCKITEKFPETGIYSNKTIVDALLSHS